MHALFAQNTYQDKLQSHVASQHVLQWVQGRLHVLQSEHGPEHNPAQHCSPPEMHGLISPNHAGWTFAGTETITSGLAAALTVAPPNHAMSVVQATNSICRMSSSIFWTRYGRWDDG